MAQMVKDTQILCASSLPTLGKDPGHSMMFEHGAAVSAIEKAETMAQEGFKPATVSAASAYHSGGGFTSGGRHALEEAFCSQSTLYPSLQQVVEAQSGKQTHIPEDGVIISPDVEIFRKGTDQGYALQM